MTRREHRTSSTGRPPVTRRRAGGDALRAGVAAFRAGRLEDALLCAERALAADGAGPDALLLAGMSCVALRRPAPAIAFLEDAVRHNPAGADGYLNLGAAYQLAGRSDEALAAFRRALALDPANADAHANLAMALRERGDFAGAETAFRGALALRPGDARLTHSLAFVLTWQGRIGDATSLYDRAVALAPQNAEYRFQRGLHRMRLGRFAEGLRDLESRWDFAGSGAVRRSFPQPQWRGGNPRGKKILVWGEQGIGDHLLYAPQVRTLAADGGRVVLETDPRLVTLFARSLPGIEAVAATDPPNPVTRARDIDAQVALASLSHHTSDWPRGSYPVRRWLMPDPERRAEIHRRLLSVAAGRPAVGIAWRSQRVQSGGHLKSMPLEAWAPVLARPDTLFVTLQYGDTDAETAAARAVIGADIYTDPEIDRFNDLEGLTALIDALDAVVTTSNVTAHFAGGLAKPTLLALSHMPFWYWSAAFDAYRSVERFRQETAEDWGPVATRIARRLDEVLA